MNCLLTKIITSLIDILNSNMVPISFTWGLHFGFISKIISIVNHPVWMSLKCCREFVEFYTKTFYKKKNPPGCALLRGVAGVLTVLYIKSKRVSLIFFFSIFIKYFYSKKTSLILCNMFLLFLFFFLPGQPKSYRTIVLVRLSYL